jgi:hypothetical protein
LTDLERAPAGPSHPAFACALGFCGQRPLEIEVEVAVLIGQ